jgi:cysteinyl-tRNA synthetase
MKLIKNYIPVLLIVAIMVGLYSCKKVTPPLLDYKRDIKYLVENISDYSHLYNKRFVVIVNDGYELLTKDAQKNGVVDLEYVSRINGMHINGLNYGPDSLNKAVTDGDRNSINDWLKISKANMIPTFVTDYSNEPAKMLESYTNNLLKAYIPYVSVNTNNTEIPNYPDTVVNSNIDSVFTTLICRNFILIPNLSNYASKHDFIEVMKNKNYDMIIIDWNFNATSTWSKLELDSLKIKANGAKRMVLSYVSIGQAQNNRFYWEKRFTDVPPLWLFDEDKKHKGYFNIKYWDSDWQHFMYGTDDSYTRKITKAGFDGVYLDKLKEGYTYWENKK